MWFWEFIWVNFFYKWLIFLTYSVAEIKEFLIKLALGKLLFFLNLKNCFFWISDQLMNLFWFSFKLNGDNFQFVSYLRISMLNSDKKELLLLFHQLKSFPLLGFLSFFKLLQIVFLSFCNIFEFIFNCKQIFINYN